LQSNVEVHVEHLEPGAFLQLETINIAEIPNANKNNVGKANFKIFFIEMKY
jgi:hypothetical protein